MVTFVDRVTLHLRAGKGGNGCVAGRREKFKPLAGPDGGTPEKPVGLVYVGVAGPTGVAAFKHRFSGTRADVRQAAAEAALRHLLDALES